MSSVPLTPGVMTIVPLTDPLSVLEQYRVAPLEEDEPTTSSEALALATKLQNEINVDHLHFRKTPKTQKVDAGAACSSSREPLRRLRHPVPPRTGPLAPGSGSWVLLLAGRGPTVR